MNTLDIIMLAPVAYGLIRGLSRGVVREVSVLLALVGGVVVAKMFAPQAAGWLLTAVNMSPRAAESLAYVALFLAVAVVLNLLARTLTRLLGRIDLGGVNRLLGAVVGGLKWLLIVSVVINLLALFDAHVQVLKPEVVAESRLYRPVSRVAAVAWNELRPEEISLSLPDND